MRSRDIVPGRNSVLKHSSMISLCSILRLKDLPIVLAAFILPLSANADDPGIDGDYAWLESLELPNPEGLRFARMVRTMRSENEKRYVYGFVSADLELPLEVARAEEVADVGDPARQQSDPTILTMDLQSIPLPMFGPDRWSRSGDTWILELADLDDYATLCLKSDPGTWFRHRSGTPYSIDEASFPRTSHLFLLSWFLKERNSPLLSRQVYERAVESLLTQHPFTIASRRGAQSFREALSMEFDQTLYVQAIERFVGLNVHRFDGFDPARHLLEFNSHDARVRLLADFEHLRMHFPQAAEISFVEHAIPILRTMIAEDRDHPPLLLEDTTGLPLPVAIEEWIYRLQDTHSVSRWPHPRSNPLYQFLIESQPESIPPLIDALDDDRFVRSIANYESSAPKSGSPHLYRVGDVAASLLRRISDEEFFLPSDTYSNWAEGIEYRRELQQRARKWWSTVEEMGEEPYLISVVSGGGEQGASLLGRLQARYPDRYVEAAIAGLKATPEILGPRLEYLKVFARIEGARFDDLYRAELKSGPDFQCRLLSAQILYRRGLKHEAVEAMLGEWRDREQVEARQSQPGTPDLPRLLEFLLTSDDPRAVDQIASDYADLTPPQRHTVVSQLHRYRNVLGEMARPKYSDAFREAVYDFLFIAWEDDTTHRDYGPFAPDEVRIGEIAGEALRKWWPSRISVRNKAQLQGANPK